ncbi:MAG: glycosyltransferase family 2 protein [Bacteroidetes bacterium]|nr:glycosyltransferase family 2 protein [Bacteroidota bacterium]
MIDRVDIIITTKNRIHDLLITIDHMLSIGFNQNQFYIVDDGSTDSTFSVIKEKYPFINIKRNDISKGLMFNRSEMMLWTKRDYILSIDDDSYIRTKEDVEDAISIMDSDCSFGIFHFRVFNQIMSPPPKNEFKKTFRFLRGYIGCGHIIKREVIQKLGRYREVLVFYCEELDYSLRAYELGYKTVTRDDLIVHHRIDLQLRENQKKTVDSKGVYGREWRNIHLYSNNVLISMLYYPFGIDLIFSFYRLVLAFYRMVLNEKQFAGYFKMLYRILCFIPYVFKEYNKLSYKNFFIWFKYPDMTDANTI